MPKKLNIIDLIGRKYNRLEIIGEADSGNKKTLMVLVKCDCGTEKPVSFNAIRSGHTKSCGCLRTELLSERENVHKIKGTAIYRIWENMKTRCYNENNKKYHCYGGRGIVVCDEWLNDPKCFYDFCISSGWTPGLQIDRKENDKGYSPDNCRFVTRKINVNNVQLLRKNNTSGYRGVKHNKSSFVASVKISGHDTLYKAGFKTAKEAAIFRDEYVVSNGIKTVLDFPTTEVKL